MNGYLTQTHIAFLCTILHHITPCVSLLQSYLHYDSKSGKMNRNNTNQGKIDNNSKLVQKWCIRNNRPCCTTQDRAEGPLYALTIQENLSVAYCGLDDATYEVPSLQSDESVHE